MSPRILVMLGVIMMATCTHAGPEQAPAVQYITDVMARVSFAQQGWGELGIGMGENDQAAMSPLPLR